MTNSLGGFASYNPDEPSEFGGDPGLIQPLSKRVYSAAAGLPGDGTYTTRETFAGMGTRTTDPTDPNALEDPSKWGEDPTILDWS